MSVTVRLAKVGKRNAPSYKIVVANTRDKRNGRFLDVLGFYNPSKSPKEFEIDKTKYTDWKKKGALSTEAVEKLLDGTYKFKPYKPKKTGAEEQSEEKPKEETSSTEQE